MFLLIPEKNANYADNSLLKGEMIVKFGRFNLAFWSFRWDQSSYHKPYQQYIDILLN